MNIFFLVIALLVISNIVIVIAVARLLGRKIALATRQQPVSTPKLPKETITRLEQQAEAAFKTSLEQATQHFDKDIQKTSQTLNQLIVRLTTSVVDEELVSYRQSLSESRAVALQSLSDMQKTVKQQQAVFETDMQAAVKDRQDMLVATLEQKISVIATNYIVEALGQGVDLGAQRDYLLDSLERNKAALKKDIVGEL